jgi:hypothetical protein
MNKAHIAAVRSLLDPHPLHAWPDTTGKNCWTDVEEQGVEQK